MIGIVCTDNQGGISKKGDIPWHLPEDLKFYKLMTQGRFNWVSLDTYKSLPTRVINDPRRSYKLLTRQSGFLKLDYEFINWPTYTFSKLKSFIDTLDDRHILIGGHQAYLKFLPMCSVIFETTLIDYNANCDLYIENLWAHYEETRISYFIANYEHPKYGRIQCHVHFLMNGSNKYDVIKEAEGYWIKILSVK